MLFDKIKKTIKENKLIQQGDSVLVGLSGGADSVCLTHLLKRASEEMGFSIQTAHLNHGIRGDEALRDERFAAEFSRNLGLKCSVKSVNIPEFAKKRGISEELAGREARYAFFKELSKQEGFNKIATAHNRNDNAETIAMHFIRGSSLNGLCGIPYKRDNIIRPLLDITRDEIEEYCRCHNLEFVTDSTNDENDYTRNKIRHFLIPLIEKEFNPNFINTVSKNAGIIKADEEYISEAADKIYSEKVKNHRIDISALLSCRKSVRSRVIRKMISDIIGISDISLDYIDDITELCRASKSGSGIDLPRGVSAKIEYGKLVIDKRREFKSYEYDLKCGCEVFVKEYGIAVRAEFADKRENDGAQYFSNVNTENMKIRCRRDGDRFFPAGMKGSKKLKDYFIDEKIPADERKRLPLITFDGEIGYIVGKRRDERFKFTGRGIKIFIRQISRFL